MDNNGDEREVVGWRVTYDAKFTLSFCLVAFLVLLFNMLTGVIVNDLLGLSSSVNLSGFYRLLSYVFCHANFQHLLGNSVLLLMLGPILERKYGTKLLVIMTVFTAVVTGLINMLLFNHGLIGASGIVFMFIVLSSATNLREKEIPLTFVLVVLIYLGGEVLNSFVDDNVSQFAHILGGVCGAVLGFLFRKRKKKAKL